MAYNGLSRRRAIRANINFGVLTRRLVNEGATTWGGLYPAWQSYDDECERLLSFLAARGELTGKAPSLIVVSDDCFVNLGEWGWGPLTMALTQRSIAYGDGLFHDPAYGKIGGVCLFWLSRVNETGVHYGSICVVNPNSEPSAALPVDMAAAICTIPVEPGPHLMEQATLSRF